MPPKCNIPDQICKNCEKSFYVPTSIIKNGGGIFCCKKCFDIWQTGRTSQIPISDRFWSKVKICGEDECWPFTANDGFNGRGIFWIGEKSYSAAKASWIITNGDPGELWVLHSCDNPPCCNQKHLFLGTRQDNVDDMMNKGRGSFHKNPIFGLRGEDHVGSKLTEKDIRRIRRLSHKLSQQEIADEIGVARTTIQSILERRTWKHVK